MVGAFAGSTKASWDGLSSSWRKESAVIRSSEEHRPYIDEASNAAVDEASNAAVNGA